VLLPPASFQYSYTTIVLFSNGMKSQYLCRLLSST